MALEFHPLRFELQIWLFAYSGHPNKLTELHLWKFKLEILLSWLPCGHPNKTGHSDEDISDWIVVVVFVLELTK